MEDGEKPRKVVEEPEEESPRSSVAIDRKKTKAGLVYGEETFTKDVQLYEIIGAKNPFDFWMIKATSEKQRIFSQLAVFAKLQEVMVEQETCNEGKEKIPVHLEKYKLYLAFHKGVNEWHRVRLLSFNRKTNSLLVYFVDYPLLELADVPMDNLRDLPDDCIGYPVVAVYRSYLYDVIPGMLNYVWGKAAVEWFLKTAKKGSVWVGLQMAWKAKWVGNGPDQAIDVGVVLFEDNDILERSMSLNYKLVKLNFGSTVGIGATHFSDLFLDNGEPLFALECVPAIQNLNWCSGKLPLFVGNRWPVVAIRSVKGPHCIYVTLMSKYKEYLTMQWIIEELFKSGLPKVNRRFVRIGSGCLVGFKNLRTGKMDIHRSVVVGENGPKTVEVLLVDVGETWTVPISTLYALPKKVKLIPAFVHRVHLNKMAPPPHRYLNFLKWTGDMAKKFGQFVREIGYGLNGGKRDPVWFVVRSDLPELYDMINLREVCQDLAFDKEDKKWIGMSETEGNLDSYEDQVMIKNHLHSFGVDLLVLKRKTSVGGEDELEEELDWGFESLAEIVKGNKEKFEVKLVGMKMDKRGYYDGLLWQRNEKKGDGC